MKTKTPAAAAAGSFDNATGLPATESAAFEALFLWLCKERSDAGFFPADAAGRAMQVEFVSSIAAAAIKRARRLAVHSAEDN